MLQGMHITPLGNRKILLEPGDSLDPSSPDDYVVDLMGALHTESTDTLIYDLKKVPLIDDIYYAWLIRLNKLCGLSNINMVIVNIRTTAAYSLATSMKESPPFKCSLDVESARQGMFVDFQKGEEENTDRSVRSSTTMPELPE